MSAEQKLPKLSKRMKAVRAKVDRSKAYPIDDALKLGWNFVSYEKKSDVSILQILIRQLPELVRLAFSI